MAGDFRLSQAGLWPSGPTASNPAPRRRGPRATPTQAYTLYRSCLCSAGAGPILFSKCGPGANENQSELRCFLTSLIIIFRSVIVTEVIAIRQCVFQFFQ